jgi:hypothetical protein
VVSRQHQARSAWAFGADFADERPMNGKSRALKAKNITEQ